MKRLTFVQSFHDLLLYHRGRLRSFSLCHHRKEEVERCKQKDLLEEMLREMTGEFPALSEVFVSERDLFLANSLQLAARPVPHPTNGKLLFLFKL